METLAPLSRPGYLEVSLWGWLLTKKKITLSPAPQSMAGGRPYCQKCVQRLALFLTGRCTYLGIFHNTVLSVLVQTAL